MNKLLSYLLKKYDPGDTEIFLKAKFILITTLFVLVTFSASIIYTAFLSGLNNPVLFTEFFGFTIMLAAFAMLVRGKYNTAIHTILVSCFATVWGVLFTEPNISLFTKVDTIVFIIGLLAAMPLLFFKSRKPMVLYFIANIVLFCFFIFYLHKTSDLTIKELLDYFFDNLLVMTFVFLISFNLFSIYKQVLGSLKKELAERKHSEDINKTLFAISNAVNITLSLEALFGQTHKLLSEIIDVTNFFIALVNERDNTLFFPYYIDTIDVDFSPIAAFNPEESLTGLVVSKRKAVLLKREQLKALSTKNGVQGAVPLVWMGVPLMIKDEVIGVIAVQSYTDPCLYNEQDLKIMSSISDQIAIAIDRKRTEDELRESEKKYRYLFNHAPVGMYEIDFIKSRFTDVNDTFIKYSGYTKKELLSINPFDLLTGESKQQFDKRYEGMVRGETVSNEFEYEILKKNGQKLCVILNNDYIYENNTLIGARVVAHNVTERKKIEEMIIQSEKMMSVGGLAAGMAHEINNPLAGMMQNSQVIHNRLTQNLEANTQVAQELGTSMNTIRQFMGKRGILKQLENIHTAGSQAAKIISNMLSFAKKSDSNKTQVNLNELIDKTIELSENDYSLKKNYDFKQIQIIRDYHPDVPPVLCEPSKIQQVLFNVIKNASESMRETIKKEPSKIIFRLKKHANSACIEIEDNGTGIDYQTRKRIFEPFFTTKSVDKGTGLGLSVSYFIIVNDHKGKMEVDSTLGKGTKFIIKLPIT
jgi:PAS domain S-box-containing protein